MQRDKKFFQKENYKSRKKVKISRGEYLVDTDRRNITQVHIVHGLDYIDFHYAEQVTRVQGCEKYRKRLHNILNDILDEMEREAKK